MDPENDKAPNSFSTWVSRTMKHYGWSERMRSISQTVPENWYNLCVDESEDICDFLKACDAEVIINADEVFFKFYHESS